uniref:Short-chain collagen C4-like n=1 Tax=Branchiostoma floridae TaxID=7739 RepID=C3YXL8_BRAFL|eukprot:XP_002598815.1 hypothetical protein BRAFLDRAFT_74508 [Branchiostoma floridae]
MTSQKIPYGHHIMPERSARRERTGSPLGSVVGVLGAAAVFASAVVLAVIVQNIGHEMGNLRARVERDQEMVAKLQERVEKSDGEITKLQALAQRDHDDMAKLQARAERDQEEVLSLRERIVVLETQIRGGSFPHNYAEQQQTSASPEGEQPGHVPETDSGVQNNNVTMGGLLRRRSKRDLSGNSLRLPPGSECHVEHNLSVSILTLDPHRYRLLPKPSGTGRSGRTGRTGGSPRTEGIAGGAHYSHSGGGANRVCLPKDPEWGVFTDGNQGYGAYMYGAEYELSTVNNPFQSVSGRNHDVPCAVCHVASRGSKLMIPARLSCPSGWTREYKGYLMTSHYAQYRSEFVCMDGEPETRPGGHVNHNGALFYPVEAYCGSLPCPNYVQGRELTCVVCTK